MKDRVLRGAARLALSPPLASLFGRKRRDGADAALDPQVAAVLELQRLLRLPPLDSMTPAQARAFAAAGLSPMDVDDVAMARVIDTRAGGVPVRLFVPDDAGDDVIVYFHGGGGVIGSVAASAPVTRFLAARTRCTVASVEYRLGPEHRHPAAIDDAVAAYTALRARFAGRIAVAGDSFGGFLAAHVDHAAATKPDLQVLIYPLVDMTHGFASIDRHADGYLLTRSLIHWFQANYLDATDDRRAASPLFWPDLHRSCPAIVVTAGYDPLVDEGDAYAAALARAGVTVRHRRHASLVHGFVGLAGAVTAAHAAITQIGDDIVELLDKVRAPVARTAT